MSLFIFYSAGNRAPVQLTLDSGYTGFVSSEDAQQIAEGFRREFNQEPNLIAVKNACIDLARQRKGVRHEPR